MNDSIEQEIIINAPIQNVWQVVTRPEHMSKWFSDTATYEPRVGSKGKLTWKDLGVYGRNGAPLEIVTVDEPHEFAFLWVSPDKETAEIDGQTLVTFRLTEVDGGTQLRVTESGFSRLALKDAVRAEHMDKHTSGWQYFLGKIQSHVDDHTA